MHSEVVFARTKVGYKSTEEEGYLGIVSDCIVAVLVCSRNGGELQNCPEWYLESGFGPCDRQGLLFNSLESAKTWIVSQLSTEK